MPITLVPEGAVLRGKVSGSLLLMRGARLEDVEVDATGHAIGVEMTGENSASNVTVFGASAHGVLMTGGYNVWCGGAVRGCGQNGFALRGFADTCHIEGVLVEDNNSFGIHLDEGACLNKIIGCSGANRLELIGVRASCWGNWLLDNIAIGSTDNGISVTGQRNIIRGNVCNGNGHNGIGVYGGHNIVSGNHCDGNNTDGNPAYASIFVKPDFGGLGIGNMIEGNICLDPIGIHLRLGATQFNTLGTNIGTVVRQGA